MPQPIALASVRLTGRAWSCAPETTTEMSYPVSRAAGRGDRLVEEEHPCQANVLRYLQASAVGPAVLDDVSGSRAARLRQASTPSHARVLASPLDTANASLTF